jgi:hypothetical protein
MLRIASLIAVLACSQCARSADLPPDVEIEKLLAGRWSEREVEEGGWLTTTTTFARGGGWSSEVVIAKGERKTTIKLSGKWRVRDKMLITTVENSNAPSIPAGTSSEEKLLELDKQTCRYRDEDGQEHTRTRLE